MRKESLPLTSSREHCNVCYTAARFVSVGGHRIEPFRRAARASLASRELDRVMRDYLRGLLPYYRQVLGTLIVGSICGVIMNTAVVLPSILLGRAIDTVSAVAAGTAAPSAVGWAALTYLGGVLLTELPRAVKRWCLERTIP